MKETNKGITLIALIITIIVMLILVAVTINIAINGGLFHYAGKAVGEMRNAINKEQELSNGKIKIDGKWYNSIDEYLNGGTNAYVEDVILPTDTDTKIYSLENIPAGAINFTITSDNRAKIGFTGTNGENLIIPAAFKEGGTWYKVVGIESEAFKDTTLASVIIPGSVSSIGKKVFYNSLVEGVVLSDGITVISELMFDSYTSRLHTVTIPASVTKIETKAFYNCYSLETINFTGTQAQWNAITKGTDWNLNAREFKVNFSSNITNSPTYSQTTSRMQSFLSSVTYIPTDYSVSYSQDYQVYSQFHYYPFGAVLNTKAGNLKIVDTATGGTISKTVSAGTNVIYNLTPVTGGDVYLDNVKIGHITPTGDIRTIKTDSVDNVRDIGGWSCDGGTIKYNKIFRGGALNSATDFDKETLTKLLNIKQEVNLVSKTESGYYTTSPLEGVQLVSDDNIAAYDGIANNSDNNLLFNSIFNAAINGNTQYVHCTAGADRTGTVIFIIESVLGVSRSDMDKDYEIGYHHRARTSDGWKALMSLFEMMPGNTMRDKVVSWLVMEGVSIDTINAFRRSMIDGTPANLEEPTLLSPPATDTQGRTNLIPSSIGTDGNIFNGIGFMHSARMTASETAVQAPNPSSWVTGLMPINKNEIIRISKYYNKADFQGDNKWNYIIQFYNADKSFNRGMNLNEFLTSTSYIANNYTWDGTTTDGTLQFEFTGTSSVFTNAKYFRLSGCYFNNGVDRLQSIKNTTVTKN